MEIVYCKIVIEVAEIDRTNERQQQWLILKTTQKSEIRQMSYTVQNMPQLMKLRQTVNSHNFPSIYFLN